MWRAGPLRDRIAVLTALATVMCIGVALFASRGLHLLMPGPLSSAHSTIEACSACHTKAGAGKLSWIQGLALGDPHADSKACLTCHKTSETALNPHGASTALLKSSTERLVGLASRTHPPRSARAQAIVFPMGDMTTKAFPCATCHQEHRVAGRDITSIANEQCRSCHTVQFQAFDVDHPKFEGYPFKRRTRIIFDHAGHFEKHFPDVEKKSPAKTIASTCSTCHDSRKDKRIMSVRPFEETCATCHLAQIVGKERVSGPKGIAFLSLPGIDLQTLKKKNVSIGEWPEDSVAPFTPFMKAMIGWNSRGRDLLRAVDGLNLQDLTKATDEQIAATAALVWEIKGLYSKLIKGKISDTLAEIETPDGQKPTPAIANDLTSALPRDVVMAAQREWLPLLAKDLGERAEAIKRAPNASGGTEKPRPDPGAPAKSTKPGPQTMGIDPSLWPGKLIYVASEGSQPLEALPIRDDSDPAIGKRWTLPSGTPRSIDAARTKEDDEGRQAPTENTETRPAAPEAGSSTVPDQASPTRAKPDEGASTPSAQPTADPGAQTDDLLSPTESELRAIKEGKPLQDAGKSPALTEPIAAPAKPGGTAPADPASPGGSPPSERAAPRPAETPVPALLLDSDLDAESWAESGGWYREDYVIYYRPAGHKDKFITTWLAFTGPSAIPGDGSAVQAVFEALTNKDAQGSCTKCHSVDQRPSRGLTVNFAPRSASSKVGEFTTFLHEPHFGIMDGEGCLTCHSLAKQRPYLKSYEQGDPKQFTSNFAEIATDRCQTCHTGGRAKQDCLTCHVYHVEPVTTPIIGTKIPGR